MNKLTKFIMLPMLTLGLAGCSLLPSAGTKVSKEAANLRVISAMNTTMTSELNSIELDLSAALMLEQKSYEGASMVQTGQMKFDIDGSLKLKAKDIRESTAKASAIVTGSVKAEENSSVTIDEEVSAEAYYKEEWAYFKVTGLQDLLENEEETMKGKIHVGDISEFTDEIPVAVSGSVEEVIPSERGFDLLMKIDKVTATEKDGDLTVVYTITEQNVIDMVVEAMVSGQDVPPTTSEIDEFTSMFTEEMGKVLDINKAMITIGIAKEGYINKFYVDVDVAITNLFEDNDVVTSKDVVRIVGDVKMDLKLNKAVTITFPEDLATYPDMSVIN